MKLTRNMISGILRGATNTPAAAWLKELVKSLCVCDTVTRPCDCTGHAEFAAEFAAALARVQAETREECIQALGRMTFGEEPEDIAKVFAIADGIAAIRALDGAQGAQS